MAKYLKEKDNTIKISYLGFEGYLEERLAKENGINFIGLKREKNRFLFFFDKKVLQSILNLKFKPDLIISTGGGHSYHILKYAKKKKIPYYLLEENVKMGLVNKLFLHSSINLFSPFKFKTRKAIHAAHPSTLINVKTAKTEYDFLFLGGSLGSDIIAKLAIKMRNMPYKNVLICGKKKEKYLKYQNKNLKILDFVELEDYYASSDIVVTRAGSSTLFELLAYNKKMIIIPSKKTRGNHQVLNAEFFQNNDLGIYFDETSVNLNTLIEISKYNFDKITLSQKKFLNTLSILPYEKIIRKA